MQNCTRTLRHQVEQMFCPKAGHHYAVINMLCLTPECKQSRLICSYCVVDHNNHRRMTPEEVEVELTQIHQQDNQTIQQVIKLVQTLKEQILKQFYNIERTISGCAEQSNPKIQQIVDEIFITDQLYPDDLNNRLQEYSTVIMEPRIDLYEQCQSLRLYIKKLNHWLADIPEFKSQEYSVDVTHLQQLKSMFSTIQKTHIKQMKYVVQTIHVKQNSQLLKISMGKASECKNACFRLQIFYGVNLGKLLYEEIFTESVDVGQYLSEFKFNKQIQLFKGCRYTIALSAVDTEFAIYEFKQPTTPLVNELIEIHPVSRYVECPPNMEVVPLYYIQNYTLQKWLI